MNHLLHNMSIRGRLLAILITFLIPIAILGYEFNNRLQIDIDFSVHESEGADMILPLFKTFGALADFDAAAMQKASGSTTVDKNITDATTAVDAQLATLAKQVDQYSDDLDLDAAGLKKHGRAETLTVANLTQRWQALKSAPYNHEALQTLGNDITALIAHVGDTSNLILDGDLDTYYLIDATFNVFPTLETSLTDLQYRGYQSLRGNGNKFDNKAHDELDTIAVELDQNYTPHVHASITTSLHEDANFNGTNQSLQTDVPKGLAAFEAQSKKVVTTVHDLANKGYELSPDSFVTTVDGLHNTTGEFVETILTTTQQMIATRVDALKQARFKSMGLSGLIVAFAFGLFFVVANSVSRPIQKMTETMVVLANGDTSVTIPSTEHKDEIGGMGRAVLVFKDTMIQTETLRQEQESLKAEAARQKSVAMNQMADDFELSVKTVVTGVSASATQMRGNAERLSSLADQTKMTSASVASSATEAAQTATQVAAAAEELTSAIGEISSQVSKSSAVAGQATSQAESINQTMHLLVEKSNRVGEVIQFITNIASQINLLALNATIESARAGEAGRGFAVVASEVKNLANQTAKATEEIVQQVQSMQEATQDAVQSVGSIIHIIGEISQSTNGVAAAVEEQSAATNEISRNIAHTATGTNEISRDIIIVEKGADETGISSREVLNSAKLLTEQSALLNEKVNDFLKTVRAM